MSNNHKRTLSEKVGEKVRIYQRDTKWYANYQVGRYQKRVSLGTNNKKNAFKKALELDRQLCDGQVVSTKQDCLIGDAIDAYVEYLVAERRSYRTIGKYQFVFGVLKRLADNLRRTMLSELDLVFADKFRADRAKTCSPKTVYTDLVIVRQLLKFAFSRRLISHDPLHGLRIRKPKPNPQPCFSPEQIESILALAPNAHRPTFQLLAETGLRFGEAQWLTWADVDFKQNVLRIRAKDGWRPKSGDERVVPLSPRLITFLAGHPRRGRWVLTAAPTIQHPSSDRQISERRCLVALKRVLGQLGIEGKLHTFRHAFISRCLTSGIEESVVRSWVGHVDAQIMKLYTHISSRVSQERIKRLVSPAVAEAEEQESK